MKRVVKNVGLEN